MPLRQLILAAAFLTSAPGQSPALGPAEPLPARLHTFNASLIMETALQGINYGGPQLENAVRALGSQGLRFPAGTLANNYLWKTDSFSEPDNDLTDWAGEQVKLFLKLGARYDLPGFARLCTKLRQEPVWVLNVYEETPASVVALLDHLDSLGLKVRDFEMANEPYWDGRSHNNVQAYIGFCKPLAEAIKKHRPDARIGACFAPLGNPANYEKLWNAPLAKEGWFDAIVFHEYYGGQGFNLEPGAPLPVEAMLHPEEMITGPLEALEKLMPGKPVWFTEWNLGVEALKQWKNRGAELHYIAAIYLTLLEHRQTIDWACFHQIHDNLFGTYFIDPETGKTETTASWELFRLLGAAFRGAEEFRPVTFVEPGLRGFATQAGGDLRLFVFNRGDKPLTCTLPDGFPDGLDLITLVCPPEVLLPLSTPLLKSTRLAGRTVSLPAYSISLIAPEALLEPAPPADTNLFPRLPHLTLWYPPFAAEQPGFAPGGTYAIDTTKLAGKELAVVKMDLSALKLEPGRSYAIDFSAGSSKGGGVVIKLPHATEPRESFLPLSPHEVPRRFYLTYDPAVNEGQLSLILTKDQIDLGSTVSLRDFRIAPAE